MLGTVEAQKEVKVSQTVLERVIIDGITIKHRNRTWSVSGLAGVTCDM